MVSLQMRKMTEQEILKEAERQSRKSRQPDSQVDLSKTSKNLSFLATASQEDPTLKSEFPAISQQDEPQKPTGLERQEESPEGDDSSPDEAYSPEETENDFP